MGDIINFTDIEENKSPKSIKSAGIACQGCDNMISLRYDIDKGKLVGACTDCHIFRYIEEIELEREED